jgi:hypothetical protein
MGTYYAISIYVMDRSQLANSHRVIYLDAIFVFSWPGPQLRSIHETRGQKITKDMEMVRP